MLELTIIWKIIYSKPTLLTSECRRRLFHKQGHFDPFHITGLFLYFLNISENLCFSDVFGGYKTSGVKCVEQNWSRQLGLASKIKGYLGWENHKFEKCSLWTTIEQLFLFRGNIIIRYGIGSYMVLCAIWYHFLQYKNVKNTCGGVLLLLKLVKVKVTLLHGCFSRFLNCGKGAKAFHNLNHSIYIKSCDSMMNSY